jgi:hypothetical protein
MRGFPALRFLNNDRTSYFSIRSEVFGPRFINLGVLVPGVPRAVVLVRQGDGQDHPEGDHQRRDDK